MMQNFTTQPALNNSHWDFTRSPSNEFAIVVVVNPQDRKLVNQQCIESQLYSLHVY
jgi:hypothetical protein